MYASYCPSLSFQSNANVLQPSTQQRRLRIVLRANFLLTDVKPPGGRRPTGPLRLKDGKQECWWRQTYFGLVLGHISLSLSLSHTYTNTRTFWCKLPLSWKLLLSTERAGEGNTLEITGTWSTSPAVFPSLSLTFVSSSLWLEVCVYYVFVGVCVCERECAKLTQGNNPIWLTCRWLCLHLRSPSLCTANRTLTLAAPRLFFFL